MTLDGKYYLIAYLGNEVEVILPSSYKDSPYEIHAYAFFLNTTLKKITIPEGVDAIGDYAFRDGNYTKCRKAAPGFLPKDLPPPPPKEALAFSESYTIPVSKSVFFAKSLITNSGTP